MIPVDFRLSHAKHSLQEIGEHGKHGLVLDNGIAHVWVQVCLLFLTCTYLASDSDLFEVHVFISMTLLYSFWSSCVVVRTPALPLFLACLLCSSSADCSVSAAAALCSARLQASKLLLIIGLKKHQKVNGKKIKMYYDRKLCCSQCNVRGL